MVYQVKSLADFKAKLEEAGDQLVVVDFYAVWCGPCKQIAPLIEDMSKIYTNVVFLKVDVDENEEISSEYKINCMPTFMFFKKNAKVDEFSGANVDMLKAKVEQLK